MSSRSGRRLNSNQWIELPITDEVIDRVDNMYKQELQQPNTTTDGIVFELEPGMPIDSDIITIKKTKIIDKIKSVTRMKCLMMKTA